MRILGLHITGIQAGAVLLEGNRIVCGAAEERFNRIKRSRDFPYQAIQFCMKEAGIRDLRELDAVAVSWNPMVHMEKINFSGFTSWRRYDPEWLYITPNNLARFIQQEISPGASRFSWESDADECIYFVDHHLAHIAGAVFPSGFRDCAVLISDEYGEYSSFTLAKVHDRNIEIIKQIPFPHSLGSFYAMLTEFLGFTPNADEWKVMGASAYGDRQRFYHQLAGLMDWDEENSDLLLDLRYFNHHNMKISTYVSPHFETLIGMKQRRSPEPLEQIHFDLAASAQEVFEKNGFKILNKLYQVTCLKNLCLSGGSFMNSLFNGKVIGSTPFTGLYIPYAAADNGGAPGAALWVAHTKLGIKVPQGDSLISSPFLGPQYSPAEIESILKNYKLPYQKSADPAVAAAQAIAQGKITGWFQGRMEFGERALGNRSILADPRDKTMKDKINRAVKYREHFRPFAPSILEEKVSEYFEIPGHIKVPYMEQVYPVKEEKRAIIPAVTHFDGTGRVQTVSQQTNPDFHRLIGRFEAITGIPVVLNTSFNIQGEPIVCTPADALRTFFTCGMDVLFLGPFVIDKKFLSTK